MITILSVSTMISAGVDKIRNAKHFGTCRKTEKQQQQKKNRRKKIKFNLLVSFTIMYSFF